MKSSAPFFECPPSRKAECRERLRDEALQRMRGTNPGVWTREDLLSVIRGKVGYLHSATQLESFVAPANYQDQVPRIGANAQQSCRLTTRIVEFAALADRLIAK